MFSKSRNSFFSILRCYRVWVTSKIQVNFRFCRCFRVLMIEPYEFPWFSYSPRFRGQGIHLSQFLKATLFGWPRNSRSTSGSAGTRGYWLLTLIDSIFVHSSFPTSSRSRNLFFDFLQSNRVWVTSITHANFRCYSCSMVLVIGYPLNRKLTSICHIIEFFYGFLVQGTQKNNNQ